MSNKPFDFEIRNTYYEKNKEKSPSLIDNQTRMRFVTFDSDEYVNIILEDKQQTHHAGSWTTDDMRMLLVKLNEFYRPQHEKPKRKYIVQSKYSQGINGIGTKMTFEVLEVVPATTKAMVATFEKQAEALEYVNRLNGVKKGD